MSGKILLFTIILITSACGVRGKLTLPSENQIVMLKSNLK
jgi:hypothetical protein